MEEAWFWKAPSGCLELENPNAIEYSHPRGQPDLPSYRIATVLSPEG